MIANVPILLVDDNRAWRETLAELLRDQGFEVWTAEGPRTGQLVLEEHPVLVVVLDFQMPDMNGLEWLRRLDRQLPVLMLSSEDDPKIAEQVLAEGALAFVSKSIPPRQLLRTLRVLLLLAVVIAIAQHVFDGELDHLLPAPDASRAVA